MKIETTKLPIAVPSPEADALLMQNTGMRWAEIAAEHEMRCGGCRGGMFHLQEVKIDMTPERPIWFDSDKAWDWPPKWEQRWKPMQWIRTVTIVLRCDTCERDLAMPLHAREG